MTAIDTNLLFAWLNRDHAWHKPAAAWFAGVAARPDLVLCELCLVELYGLLRNPAVVKRPLDAPDAVAVIERRCGTACITRAGVPSRSSGRWGRGPPSFRGRNYGATAFAPRRASGEGGWLGTELVA